VTEESFDLRVRTKKFALRIIRLYVSLPKTSEAQVLGKQVLKSGTSVGAHYREAIRARPSILHSAFCVLLFLFLGAYQLHLPGLHYDEAKEAGLNAMQLVTGQPVTAFRDATMQLGPWRLPLMVQDYIGSLNVLLATPFLAVSGVNPLTGTFRVVALRWLPLLTAALTLLLTGRIAWRLGGPVAATVTMLLLAVNPSFVFWSRQGIFVTNLTALIFMASLLTGLRWWADRRPRDLWLTAFLWGLGIYAKLLFVWAIGAMVGVAAVAWVANGRWQMANGKAAIPNPQSPIPNPQLLLRTCLIALACFLLPLIPLLLFNLRTGGTLTSIFGNLGHSYYGVDNRAYLPNLLTRLGQLRTLLRGDHFWYLGGVFANPWAPWAAGGLVVFALGAGEQGGREAGGQGGRGAGEQGSRGAEGQESGGDARHGPRTSLAGPVTLSPYHLVTLSPCHLVTLSLLLVLIVAQSAFTVSDLFITHYVLLLPLLPLAGGLAAGYVMQNAECRMSKIPVGGQKSVRSAFIILTSAFLLLWAGGDLWITVRYHRALAATGGHSAHSDTIYDLAAYLDRGGLTAPLALDWGLDAPVRFLTVGRVNPIEVFGYASLDAPDAGFTDRVHPFLANPNNVYLAHAPEETVFRGRVEALAALAQAQGLALRAEARFAERSGRPLFVVYRAVILLPHVRAHAPAMAAPVALREKPPDWTKDQETGR
jgi:hypothetical protein